MREGLKDDELDNQFLQTGESLMRRVCYHLAVSIMSRFPFSLVFSSFTTSVKVFSFLTKSWLYTSLSFLPLHPSSLYNGTGFCLYRSESNSNHDIVRWDRRSTWEPSRRKERSLDQVNLQWKRRFFFSFFGTPLWIKVWIQGRGQLHIKMEITVKLNTYKNSLNIRKRYSQIHTPKRVI